MHSPDGYTSVNPKYVLLLRKGLDLGKNPKYFDLWIHLVKGEKMVWKYPSFGAREKAIRDFIKAFNKLDFHSKT